MDFINLHTTTCIELPTKAANGLMGHMGHFFGMGQWAMDHAMMADEVNTQL